mmetsp:Transcript_30508/g.46209  ORF Transcript_30508/g.46209 Transcript_30508/m.46209 type:complete len:516 (-) Transcript_30508:1623-3170(-)
MAEDKKKNEESKTADAKKSEESPSPISTPPLEAAARRLDRLLGGDRKTLHSYTNPAKVIRRWLGTASGAAGDATLDTIASAAATLLDPAGACAEGKALLTAGNTVSKPMDVEETESNYLSQTSEREVEIWLLSLVVRVYWKGKKLAEAFTLAQKTIEIVSKHIDDASANVANASKPTTSSLFPLLARMYRYRSLVCESKPELVLNLHTDMIKAHGLASLRRDVDSQATLLNLMLHDLLNASQVEQAQKLLVNSTFPDSASNNQLCRYLYHSGRIQALRLEYTSAFSNLSQCLRKAPTNTGLGFRISAQRLLVVVQLLMGEIPDRHIFLTPSMRAELAPYMAITQAVRRGDLSVFTAAVSEHATRLQEDGTYTLISRLAHQVVKAGLRKLHISYSRISLEDVAERLGLPSATSAEFVVAKAVRDGVLDATIHHEEGYVQSHDLVDVYATQEPAKAFHRRIAYCLTTHNDAVRGMRYPPDAYKKQLEASRGNRKNTGDDKTDEEKAQELEDELDDEY